MRGRRRLPRDFSGNERIGYFLATLRLAAYGKTGRRRCSCFGFSEWCLAFDWEGRMGMGALLYFARRTFKPRCSVDTLPIVRMLIRSNFRPTTFAYTVQSSLCLQGKRRLE